MQGTKDNDTRRLFRLEELMKGLEYEIERNRKTLGEERYKAMNKNYGDIIDNYQTYINEREVRKE